jgi:protein-disulfide isomerase
MISKKMIFIGAGLVVVLGLAGASCINIDANKNASLLEQDRVASNLTSDSSTNAEYYSQDAKVMEFYSEYCGWCVKQKDVLASLAKQGYKVKPMDVGAHQDYWQQYGISGTPTFVGPDGQKVVGYQDEAALKAFLDKYK